MSNILFICTANRDRSRTAEIYFQNKHPEHRFRSAGTNRFLSERHGGTFVQGYMIANATRIVCMEEQHKELIMAKFGNGIESIIEVLNLGDTDTFMSPQLIEQLELKFKL